MTAEDWARILTGDVDELPPLADWIEEQGMSEMAAHARDLFSLAVAVLCALDECEEDGRPAFLVEFRQATNRKGIDTSGYRTLFDPVVGSTDWWREFPCAALVALGASGTRYHPAYPARFWIERACNVGLVTVWQANREWDRRVRFRVRKGGEEVNKKSEK